MYNIYCKYNDFMKGDVKMKDKIILFIIGVLVGAIISTGAFYVYTTTSNSCSSNEMNDGQSMQMPGENPPSMPDGQNSENGQPPEMPNNNQSNSN